MGKIVELTFEEFNDNMNTTHFIKGSNSRLVVLEEDNIVYERFGTNSYGESMYFKTDFDDYCRRKRLSRCGTQEG